MNKEELKRRTKNFAHRCVKLCFSLPKNDLGNHIRSQLIRSSTSVATNYRAACIAQSKASFISKLSISIEESDECCFWLEFIINEKLLKKERVISLLREAEVPTSRDWLEFIVEENLLEKRLVKPLLNETDELLSIFISSRKTARGVD